MAVTIAIFYQSYVCIIFRRLSNINSKYFTEAFISLGSYSTVIYIAINYTGMKFMQMINMHSAISTFQMDHI